MKSTYAYQEERELFYIEGLNVVRNMANLPVHDMACSYDEQYGLKALFGSHADEISCFEQQRRTETATQRQHDILMLENSSEPVVLAKPQTKIKAHHFPL